MAVRRKRRLILVVLFLAGATAFYYWPNTNNRNMRKVPQVEDCQEGLNISSPRIIIKGGQHNIGCKLSKPTVRSCYKDTSSDAKNAMCTSKEVFQFCQLKVIGHNKRSAVCKEDKRCSPGLLLGIAMQDEENLEWEDFSSSSALAFYINSILDESNKKIHQGFIFVKCQLDLSMTVKNKSTEGNVSSKIPREGVQLLVLPPKLSLVKHSAKKSTEQTPKKHISINLIKLGSVSRVGLYHNLPVTMKSLYNLNTNTTTHVEVLDYKLVQPLSSSPRNNLLALFAGTVEFNTTNHKLQGQSMPVQDLLGRYLLQGYKTLWIDSHCWSQDRGLASYLGIHSGTAGVGPEQRTRDRLAEQMLLAGIEEIGITQAGCHLGGEMRCINGKHKAEYYLEYLQHYQSRMSDHRMPYVSIFSTGLDRSDLQEIDKPLEKYIRNAATYRDTITIIFSEQSGDPRSSLPLLMVVPQHAKEVMKEVEWQSFVENQDRLTSLLDLHYGLRGLLKSLSPIGLFDFPKASQSNKQSNSFLKKFIHNIRGLLSEIPISRRCPDIPRVSPGCVCEPDRSPKYIDNRVEGLAEFATQYWNEIIRRRGRGCDRVKTVRVKSAESILQGTSDLFPEMEISVEVGSEVNEQAATHTLMVHTAENHLSKRIAASLSSQHVMQCTEDRQDKEEKKKKILSYMRDQNLAFSGSKQSEPLFVEEGQDCLFLLDVKLKAVSIVQMVSLCPSQVHVTLDFSCPTDLSLRTGRVSVTVPSLEIVLVNVMVSMRSDLQPKWEYTLGDIDFNSEEEGGIAEK